MAQLHGAKVGATSALTSYFLSRNSKALNFNSRASQRFSGLRNEPLELVFRRDPDYNTQRLATNDLP